MSIIEPASLATLAKEMDGRRIIFCSGSFDMTHVGHVLFLESCKALGDVLVVGVGDDENIRAYKGAGRPVMNEHMRLKMVDSLKPVDYCFLVSNPKERPYQFLEYVLPTLRPAQYVINDDARDREEREALCERYAIPLTILSRECPPQYDQVSTSGIIKKTIDSHKHSI